MSGQESAAETALLAAVRETGACPPRGTQSIRRALQILRIIAAGRESGVLMQDIVALTGLARPTCHRILSLLVEEGIIERKSRTRRYAIGVQIPHLALARSTDSPLIEAAKAYLDRAAESIGDTTFLTIRSKNDTLCIARRIGRFPVQVLALEVGGRRPLGVSSAGIAMLSHLPPESVFAIIGCNERRLSDYEMTIERVLTEVDDARYKGYALRKRGLIPGTMAASVVLDSGDDEALAAITIAAVRQRFTGKRFTSVIEFLMQSKEEIERCLHQETDLNKVSM